MYRSPETIGTLYVVVGPTAVGKTAFCIELAQKLAAEIISADARQCYRGLVIGTAQPTAEERKLVPHHMIDFLALDEPYNAVRFAEDVTELLPRCFARSPYALLTGGSGFYIQALTKGLPVMPRVPVAIQDELIAIHATQGLDPLLAELKSQDPTYYAEVHHANARRVLRALGICRISDKPFSYWRAQPKVSLLAGVQCIQLGLYRPREELYERIDQRVDQMVSEGLFEEAAGFFRQRHLPALQTIGYQEVFAYMEGKCSQEEAIALIKKNTRHYAKRQMTWFKRDTSIIWYTPEEAKAWIAAAEEM